MVNAANLLLDAASAPQTASYAGLGQAAQDQDPSSSPFLAIVQDLMGSGEQAAADTVRAGQEDALGEQPVEGEEPKSSDATADMGYLLGSVQIACNEAQALPNQTVTDMPVTQESDLTAVQSSTTQVAPSTAQPTMVEPSAESDSAESAQTAESLPEPAVGPDVQAQDVGAIGTSAQVTGDQPVQSAEAATSPAEMRQSDSQIRLAREDRPAGRTEAREHAERSELPEYLRNIIPQDGSRYGDRVVITRGSQVIEPAMEVDPELAMAQVDRPEQGDLTTDLPSADQSVQWTPIETRPVTDTTVRTIAASTPSQPIDQVERANIIHQIVRTAKVHAFDGGGEMIMRLEPAHLGSIQMSVTADNGVVTAHLKTGTESVRQMLESEIVMLRQSLAESGIHVDSISVSVGDSLGQGWNWHAGTQNGSQFAGNQQNGHAAARFYRGESDAASSEQPRAVYTGAGFNYLA